GIYLTFDNGYEEGHTNDVLDVLKEENVPATFFVTGHYVKDQPKLIQRMVKEGHIIGNHSYHHPDFTVISKKSIQEELDSLEKEVADRKSTRLNSSHVSISYAVFCLKKKKMENATSS